MDLAAREVVQLGEGQSARYVEVRELTLAEFRQWLAAAASREATGDWLYVTLLEELDCADLMHFTDLQQAGIEACTPSELRHISVRVKALNADFFGALGRLATPCPPSANSPTSN